MKILLTTCACVFAFYSVLLGLVYGLDQYEAAVYEREHRPCMCEESK